MSRFVKFICLGILPSLVVACSSSTNTLETDKHSVNESVQTSIRDSKERVPNEAIRAKAGRISASSVSNIAVQFETNTEHVTSQIADIKEILAALASSDRLQSIPLEPGNAEDEIGSISITQKNGSIASFRFHPDDLESRWGILVSKAIARLKGTV